MKPSFFHGIVVGFVVALSFMALLIPYTQRKSWNMAVDKSARVVAETTNRFGGLDFAYDKGFERALEQSFDSVKELKK